MPRGKKISPDIQWMIFRPYNLLNTEQLAIRLGLSTRSIEHFKSLFRAYGTIQNEDPAQENTDRRSLRGVDVEVRQ